MKQKDALLLTSLHFLESEIFYLCDIILLLVLRARWNDLTPFRSAQLKLKKEVIDPVIRALWNHLFPFRTEM